MKEKLKPAVTVIMATYNRANFIEESLKYILLQSFLNFECLIIDDGSTDNTFEIVSNVTVADKRFKYFPRHQKYKKGLPGCRNMGLELAKGDYVVFFDDDDIPHPKLLEWTIKEIETANVDYCRYIRTVFQGEFLPDFNYQENYEIKILDNFIVEKMVTEKIPFNSCQVLWKKACFVDILFNEELMFAEEWECYTRILLQNVTGISLEKALYFGRKHPNSNTGEFWNANPVRMKSKVKAIMLVVDNLKSYQLLNDKLVKHFIRWGFLFDKPEIINYTLKKSNSGIFKTAKYKIGFIFYPFLKPLFKLKSKYRLT